MCQKLLGYKTLHSADCIRAFVNKDMVAVKTTYKKIDRSLALGTQKEVHRKHNKAILALLLIGLVFLYACGKKTEYTNEIVIHVPEVSREYDYFLLNDMHIFIENSEINEDRTDLVRNRINEFSYEGKTSAENFADWIGNLPEKNLDGVILNADIIDQRSVANLEFVTDKLHNLSIPWMYLMSDHDYATEWTTITDEGSAEISKIVEAEGYDRGIYYFEEEGFIILGINKSWMSISEETLSEIKNLWNKNKPIILVTHVPYDSVIADDLADLSREVKGDRVLLWGINEGDYYYPSEPMLEFLNMISEESSPVVAIISAHLHTSYNTMFNDNISEYIVGTGYSGVRTLIRVMP